MAKDDRSALNPFTNKKHLDLIDDDEFLNQCYSEYQKIITNSQLLDNTEQGQLVIGIANNLINAVESFLKQIGRYDYVEDYYDWEVHLLADHTINAWCMPGGKIVMYSGMLGPAESEDDLALIIGHEMAHALLDHSRTQASARNAKNAITTAAWVGSLGLSLFGLGELGALTRTVTSVADIGSEFLLMKPFSREHEFEADKLGLMMMHWAGYDISGAPDFWTRVSNLNKNEFDFFSTHPADSKRIATMRELISEIDEGKDFYNAPVLGTGTVTTSRPKLTLECPKCNNLLEEGSKFCIYCGENLENNNSMMDCPNCGKLITDDSKFCTFCGFNLEGNDDLVCKNCGKVLKQSDKFCTECGTRVGQQATEKVCSKCGKQLSDDELFCTNCGTKV